MVKTQCRRSEIRRIIIPKRNTYGANDVMPGLLGWAQINGRDELEIKEKAKLDGAYTKRLSFCFDCICFAGSNAVVLRRDSVLEGGMGVKQKKRGNYEHLDCKDGREYDN